jgi:hypothetical protein
VRGRDGTAGGGAGAAGRGRAEAEAAAEAEEGAAAEETKTTQPTKLLPGAVGCRGGEGSVRRSGSTISHSCPPPTTPTVGL